MAILVMAMGGAVGLAWQGVLGAIVFAVLGLLLLRWFPHPVARLEQRVLRRLGRIAPLAALPAPASPAMALERDEADLYIRSGHRIITNHPAVYYCELFIDFKFILNESTKITLFDDRCKAYVFATRDDNGNIVKDDTHPILEFEMELMGRDALPTGELHLDRASLVRFRGGINYYNDRPSSTPLLVEFVFRDATEAYDARVSFLMEYIDDGRWHAFSDPQKYPIEPLVP